MKEFSACTSKGQGYLNILKCKAKIIADTKMHPNGISKVYENGIWDTGASMTTISTRIAEELNLIPCGKAVSNTANGKNIVDLYVVSVELPNNVLIENVQVASGNLTEDTDFLIGMDIISQGDFAVTNAENKTVFSYRYPSCETIDYCLEATKINKKRYEKRQKEIEDVIKKRGNTKCFCGSGKKYRYCHGKKELDELKKKKELVK